jgi:hypothetical protein
VSAGDEGLPSGQAIAMLDKDFSRGDDLDRDKLRMDR